MRSHAIVNFATSRYPGLQAWAATAGAFRSVFSTTRWAEAVCDLPPARLGLAPEIWPHASALGRHAACANLCMCTAELTPLCKLQLAAAYADFGAAYAHMHGACAGQCLSACPSWLPRLPMHMRMHAHDAHHMLQTLGASGRRGQQAAAARGHAQTASRAFLAFCTACF